ncbi:MAG TPA: efflux RND transporter permease subunit, partial [Longimicrobium sp.]|nr:efflux RND transporter permease subunit [Longimicrobium sp.]
MLISDFAIKKPVVTVVTMLALVVFGLFALWNLDTDEFPEVNPPIVNVAVPYPGASPDIVEREVVEPMEEAIAGISGVDRVTSQSLDGFGTILVEFNFEKDLQQATQDIRDAVSQIRSDLPQEMEEPILTRFDPNDQPIVSLTLSSQAMRSPELTRLADPVITRQLRGLQGVAEVNVVGGVERELTVEVDPQRMQAAGIGIPQVVQAVQSQNLAAPVGRINGALDERTIRLRGRLADAAEFSQLVVAQRGGQIIRLGEIAAVRDGTEEPRSVALFNGRPAVGIEVVKSQGYSTTAVSERVIAEIDKLQGTLPAGVKLDVVQNAGERVENSVDNVQETLIEGALLTVLVVFLFLNSWRSTVITGLALPVSVLASFTAVWAFGFTLNTMSLLGLSLAIGILIDDAIVVRENIVRHVEMGKDHYTAAREGTDEIGLAVAATTFSIVCVFVPIAFMGSLAEQWFAPFALTIACSVLVSLFVSFSLDPMLSAYWPDPHVPEDKKWWITRTLDRFNRWFDHQAHRYRGVIGWALDHRLFIVMLALGMFLGALQIPATGILGFAVVLGMSLLAAVIAPLVPTGRRRRGKILGGIGRTAVVLGSLVLGMMAAGMVPVVFKLGGEFFPADDRSEFIVEIDTPPGSNLAYTQMKAEEVATLARSKPEVRYTYTTVGGRGGSVDEASVYVRLTPKGERARGQDEIAAGLREDAKRIGGAEAALATGGFGNQKQIQIQLRGPDIETLNKLAEQVMAEVKQVPGAVDVGLSTKGQRPELTVQLDRGLAGSLGVTAGQVAQALRPAFAGIDAGDWVDPSGETRDVYVRFSPEARSRTANLEAVPLVLPGGGGGAGAPGAGGGGPVTVPLGQVARVERNLGPAVISHLDRERVINVEANTEGIPLTDVVAGITQRLERVSIPAGYQVSQGGETEDQNEVFGRIFFALGVAVMLMYLILVVQFGSFLDPMAIMLSLPLSLVGVMLGLLLTGNTLNIMSMIGVILLMGIVAKNAILLIDFAIWSQEKGLPRREALIEAGAIRLRPILMTTFALIAGMIPVALGTGEGAQFRSPLGVAVIGGTITSTLLTLIAIPTFYEILDEMRENTMAFFGRKSTHSAGSHGGGHGGQDAGERPRRV